MRKTYWEELYKVRLASSIPEMDKHDVVKLLLVRKILQKYKRKDWIHIYTEFELSNGCRPDVYFEHVRDKSIIIFEIQKDFSKEWLKTKTKQYEDYKSPLDYFTIDFIPINLNDCPENINEISKWLEKYVF